MEGTRLAGSGKRSIGRGGRQARPGATGRRTKITAGVLAALVVAGLAQATHRVAPGDTLIKIAQLYKTTTAAIAQANGITDPSLIIAGRTLVIPDPPAAGAPPAAAPAGPIREHRVAAGENLTKIAQKYDTTVRSLIELNALRNPSLIRAGQVLKIPPPPTVDQLLTKYAERFGVSAPLVKAVAWQESGYNQAAVSSKGALGVMQLMPDTALFTGKYLLNEPVDPANLEQNIRAGVRFLAYLMELTGGDKPLAVSGYFQGLKNIREQGLSPATQRYTTNVLALEKRFGG
jgi:soluble lytic murein transglycosylase-like protein